MIEILTIQLRRDTSTNWSALNPVLHQGELGVEIDTFKAKLGDGVTTWASLGYWPVNMALLTGASFTGPVVPAVVNLTDAASVLVNAQLGNDYRLLLTSAVGGSRSIANPTNPQDGQDISFLFTQPASGGPCSVVWGSAFDFGSAGSPLLTTAASASDLVAFKYIAFKSKWIYLGLGAGY